LKKDFLHKERESKVKRRMQRIDIGIDSHEKQNFNDKSFFLAERFEKKKREKISFQKLLQRAKSIISLILTDFTSGLNLFGKSSHLIPIN